MKKLCPPDFNFAPPPPRSREAGDAPGLGSSVKSCFFLLLSFDQGKLVMKRKECAVTKITKIFAG